MFVGLTDEMKEILKELKGKRIITFEGAFEKDWNRLYAYFRINMDNESIDFNNEEAYVEFIGEKEEVAYLKCQNSIHKTIADEFGLATNYSSSKIFVDDIVKEINIISETISKEGNDILEYDKGIEIVTEKHTYMFYTKSWFDEYIYYSIDNNCFDELYPIQEDIEVYKNGEDIDIKIERFRKSL